MQNQRYRTIMCKYFNCDKPCPLGSRCHFAHGKDELRRMNDPLPKNTPLVSTSQLIKADPNSDTAANPIVVNNYKTMICKYWEQGKCKFQQTCSFAHGDVEKRNQDMNGPYGDNLSIDPLKVPAFEYNLRYQQLVKISTELMQAYPTNVELQGMLVQVQEALSNWKINSAAELLMKFIYKPNITDAEKQLNRKIVKNACIYAEQYLEFCKNEQFQQMLANIMQQQSMQNPVLYRQQ